MRPDVRLLCGLCGLCVEKQQAKFGNMRRKDVAFAVIGAIAAAVCIRLGLWQLARLDERKAFNEQLRARAEMPPVPVMELPNDTAAAHYRRVNVSGLYDFEKEFVLTNRSRQGSPGVNIITPVRFPGRDTAVLVNRGWVYAPDGMTVDLTRWREPLEMSGDGFIENYSTGKGIVNTARRPRAWRWMDREALARSFPYPIAPYYIVLIAQGKDTPANVPPRLGVPPLDEGPHRSYAFQWFSFATISIIGMILFLRRK